LREESDPVRIKQAKKLLFILYGSLGLIAVSLHCLTLRETLGMTTHANFGQFRILFRIIEFSAGAGTKLTHEFRSHEVYQYVFDAMPMFFALVLMNVLHPGTVLAGDDSKFAKQTKEEKKAAKEQKKADKAARKAEKNGEKTDSSV